MRHCPAELARALLPHERVRSRAVNPRERGYAGAGKEEMGKRIFERGETVLENGGRGAKYGAKMSLAIQCGAVGFCRK